MKVSLLKYACLERGGGARQMFSLGIELQRLGVEVEVCMHHFDPKRAWPEITRDLHIRAVRIADGPVRMGRSLVANAARYAGAGQLARLVSDDVEVLNPHEWGALRPSVIAKRGRPIVWMSNDPGSWDYVLAGLPSQRKWMNPLLARAVRFADARLSTDHVERVLVLDERNRRILHRAKRLRARVIRSGIDIERFRKPTDRDAARAQLGLDGNFTVLAVGVLMWHRRFEDLLRAFGDVAGKRDRLVIIGAPHLAPEYFALLQRIAGELNVTDRVRFQTDQVTDGELQQYFAAADAFVFPNDGQTWGLAAVEAMASGVPVIVSTGAGVHEIIEHGSNGYVVEPCHPELIAAALTRIRDNASEAATIGANGRDYVLQHLSWRRYAQDMLGHFQEVLRDPRAAQRETHSK